MLIQTIMPFVIFIILFVLIIVLNYSKRQEQQFDERQELIRGIAYKHGFLGMLLLGTALFYLSQSSLLPWMGADAAMIITGFAGILIFVLECVWREAFFSYDETPVIRTIFFLAIGLLNLYNGIHSNGSEGGNEGTGGLIMICCGTLFLCTALMIVIRVYLVGNQDE